MRRVLARCGWTLALATMPIAYACAGADGEVLRLVTSEGGSDAPHPLSDAPADAIGPDADGSSVRDGGPDTIDAEAGADANEPDACAGKDLSSDPEHCGACFHDCLGGGCTGGVCSPMLVTSAQSPAGIAVDEQRVYFASVVADGGIFSTAKDGSDRRVLASGIPSPGRVAVDDVSVFFTTFAAPGIVGKVPKDGGAASPLSTGGAFPQEIRVDGAALLWTDQGRFIRRSSVDGIPDGGLAPAIVSLQGIWGLTVVDQEVVFTTRGTFSTPDGGVGGFYDDDGTVVAAPKAGGTMRTLATGQGDPLGVAGDSVGTYWVNAHTGSVMSLTTGQNVPTPIATNQLGPWGIAVDATHVYFTCSGPTDGQGSVRRLRRDGVGGIEILATDLGFPSTIVLDDRAVYWTNTHGNSVMRVAK